MVTLKKTQCIIITGLLTLVQSRYLSNHKDIRCHLSVETSTYIIFSSNPTRDIWQPIIFFFISIIWSSFGCINGIMKCITFGVWPFFPSALFTFFSLYFFSVFRWSNIYYSILRFTEYFLCSSHFTVETICWIFISDTIFSTSKISIWFFMSSLSLLDVSISLLRICIFFSLVLSEILITQWDIFII